MIKKNNSMFERYSNSFLKDFDFNTLVNKFSQKNFLNFCKGSFIYYEKDLIASVHFILSGEVNICRFDNNFNICKASRGDIIGLDDVLTGGYYTNSSYAETDVNTLAITKKDFMGLLMRKDEFNLWVLKYLSYRINSLC
jgi:CRP-like cAMP-binding protein